MHSHLCKSQQPEGCEEVHGAATARTFAHVASVRVPAEHDVVSCPESEYPAIAFQYDLSPISIVVQQTRMPAYQFLTSSCAIIGGVFTVFGMVVTILDTSGEAFSKKLI